MGWNQPSHGLPAIGALAEVTSEEDSLICAPGRDEGMEDADADGE
jgi:hypothetical protein